MTKLILITHVHVVIAEYLRKTIITRTWKIAIISGTFFGIEQSRYTIKHHVNNKGKLVNKQSKCQSFILILMVNVNNILC